jgi:hypothetical protein
MQNLLLQAVLNELDVTGRLVHTGARSHVGMLYLPRSEWLLTSQRKTLTGGVAYIIPWLPPQVDHIPEAFHVTATISNDRNGGSSFTQTHKLQG